MKQQNKPAWEKEFERRTDPNNYKNGEGDSLLFSFDGKLEWYPESPYELDHSKVKAFIHKQRQAVRDEIVEQIRNNIGSLRQWLNEKPANRLVTNEDIELWLALDDVIKLIKEHE